MARTKVMLIDPLKRRSNRINSPWRKEHLNLVRSMAEKHPDNAYYQRLKDYYFPKPKSELEVLAEVANKEKKLTIHEKMKLHHDEMERELWTIKEDQDFCVLIDNTGNSDETGY